jgi:hypothetical protein
MIPKNRDVKEWVSEKTLKRQLSFLECVLPAIG